MPDKRWIFALNESDKITVFLFNPFRAAVEILASYQGFRFATPAVIVIRPFQGRSQ